MHTLDLEPPTSASFWSRCALLTALNSLTTPLHDRRPYNRQTRERICDAHVRHKDANSHAPVDASLLTLLEYMIWQTADSMKAKQTCPLALLAVYGPAVQDHGKCVLLQVKVSLA